MLLLIIINLKNTYTLLYIYIKEPTKLIPRITWHTYLLATSSLPPSYPLATLISDKTMAIDKKMRTFALY